MAASLTILLGFYAVFCGIQLLGEAATNAQASQRGLERLAATALLPAVLVTLVLTPLLSFAHVGALGRGGEGGRGGAGGRRLVAGLTKATSVAATVALLTCAVLLMLGADDGAVVQIGADGHLDRGRGDVARLNIK